jgi:two-component system, chemotaxis family, chemotaxis protein CheY
VRAPLSILLVEDTSSDSELFSLLAARERVGFGVTVVETVEQALEALTDHRRFALVLCDLHLPGKSGIDLLLSMKSDPTFSLIPFLVTTNSAHPSEIARVYAAGAAACLTKPADLDELSAFVHALDEFWFKRVTFAER